ncbi:MAG: AI-2E family transporter [Bacillota bacterium]|nr:AI-2E family transporter [Bacillota bacterium]HHT91619.1 AI-2E family transporter [Bacillota bacterium]
MPPALLAVIGFCGILLLLRFVFPYVAPFLFGLFLAFLLDIPVSYLESKGWSRSLSSLVLAALTFVTLPLVLTFVLLQLWQEVQGLAFFSSMFSEQAAQLFEAIPMLEAGISLPTLLKWALAIPDLFLIWMLTALSAYFVCRDKRTLAKFLVKQLPKTEAFRVRQVYQHTSGALWHYLQMQLLLMVISTGVSMIFFGILELPFPLLSGFLVGFFDLCPILGPGLVYLSLALLQLWWGNTAKALALGLGYLILLLLRQWGEPHLVSERIGLHPLVALLGLYAAFRFLGPLGALVGPLLLILIKALMGSLSPS